MIVRQGFPDSFFFKYQKVMVTLVWVVCGATIIFIVVVFGFWIVVIESNRENRSRR